MIRHTPILPHRPTGSAYLLPAIFLLLAAATLNSCSMGIFARSLFGEELDITINVDEVANNNLPLAMTVLYIYDEEMFKQLLGFSAQQWYEERAHLEEHHRDDPAFEAFDWEWVPGQDTTVAVPFRTSAVGAIIFANYFTEGQHRVRIDPYTDISVECGFDYLKVETIP